MKRLVKKAQWIDGPRELHDETLQYSNQMNITYIEEGRISLDSIKGLKGFSGENHGFSDGFFGKYPEEEWNKFLEDIKSNGIKEPIEILVGYDGKASIYNGNHRLQAAIQLRLNDVPVVIKYRDDSEKNYRIL